jgi:putative membrane protein
MDKKKIVICIDRDDDIGRKLKVEGPILGIEENLKVAEKLAIQDPEDTDVNAIYGAVKIANELNAEIATLTGDIEVGVTSDTKISEQLDEIIEKFKPEGVILVTDGAEDEEILPLIQSRIKIDSKRTIIVRQSQELEKAYFTITHFIQEISEDPNLARLVFGIPGLIFILIALGGALGIITQSLLAILFLIGVYLVIKGLGYEEEFFSRISEFLRSLSIERISTLTYFLALITLIIGLGYSYGEYSKENPIDIMESIITIFTLQSLGIVILAIIIAIIGKILDDYGMERYLSIRKDIILLSFILLITLMAHSAANYWKGNGEIGDFVLSVILGILLFGLVIKVTEYLFIDEIQARKNLILQYMNKKVYSKKEGKEIGKVSKVLLDGSKFLGVKVGKQKILKEDILPLEEEEEGKEEESGKIFVNI